MYRKMLAILGAMTTVAIGGLTGTAGAVDIVWTGGDGFWDEPKWNGTFLATELVGAKDGSNGYASLNGGETFVIGGGATVTYDANFLRSDFRIKQGSGMRIHEGATWLQPTDEFWSENRWTEYDGSELILDNGTFRRVGSVPGEGGGAMIFGSWRGDDNFNNPLSPFMHQETHISITNGGQFINEGQLWFGSWGDTAPNGTVVSMTINDGSLDLTGGDVLGVGDFTDADLVFTNRFPPSQVENQPTYIINFTGPGSITVDRSGIVNTHKDDFEIWQNLEPITYEDLWNAGILQANGRSGPDGASFASFFTTTGQLGMDDYMLISMVSDVMPLTGDYNNGGQVEQGDLDLVLLNWGAQTPPVPAGWTNDLPEGIIDQAELDRVLLNWGNTAAAGLTSAAVPEPATWSLLGMAVFFLAAFVRSRGSRG